MFRRFFDRMLEQCQQAGLVWGRELYIDGTKVEVNASLDSLKPRFTVEAHLANLFERDSEESAQEMEQKPPPEVASSEPDEQEMRAPVPLPTPLPNPEYEELALHNAQRHDWLEQLGAQQRSVTSRGSQRMADLRVSTTDPDATLIETKNGSAMGYRTHSVVDGGKARIILAALVTPFEVTDNPPMLDLLWRTRFRWKLWLGQAPGDRKYGTEEHIVAIESQHIRAYIPLPDHDHRDFRSLALSSSGMMPNVISTSAQQTKNCTFGSSKPPSDLACIAHAPRMVITVRVIRAVYHQYTRPQPMPQCG